jgi:hypothetical protein
VASIVVILFYQWLDVQGLLYSDLPVVGLGMVLAYALMVAIFVAAVELLTPGPSTPGNPHRNGAPPLLHLGGTIRVPYQNPFIALLGIG